MPTRPLHARRSTVLSAPMFPVERSRCVSVSGGKRLGAHEASSPSEGAGWPESLIIPGTKQLSALCQSWGSSVGRQKPAPQNTRLSAGGLSRVVKEGDT